MMGAIGTGNIREGIATMMVLLVPCMFIRKSHMFNLPPMDANFCSLIMAGYHWLV